MNIILDTSTIQHEMSGTGYYTYNMLQVLTSMDSIKRIHALGGNSKIIRQQDSEKIVSHFADETSWHRLLNLKMAGNRPNIRGDAALFPNYFMPPGFPVPSIVTIHDLSFITHPHLYSWKMRKFYQWRIQHTFSCASQILTVSEASKDHIQDYSKLDPEKINSISPGPTLPTAHTTNLIHKPRPYFLWNGNIEKRKNIIATMEAFLDSGLRQHHLVIAGKRHCDDRYWKEFNRLLRESDRLHYLGYADNSELKEWYAGSAGIVYCSQVEGFGIPVVNARAMQKPSLISTDPALMEAGGDGAFTARTNSKKDMINGLRALAENSLLDESNETAYISEHKRRWKDFSDRLEEVLNRTAFAVRKPKIVAISPSENFFLNDIQKAILQTLAYSAVFKAPIKMKECYLELQHVSCSYKDFKQAVHELAVSYPGMIIKEEEYLGLAPYTKPVDHYREAFKANADFIEKHSRLVALIGWLPFVSGVYFSGGTVHASHIDKKDLDLFIVSDSNTVWLVYTMLKLLAKFSRTEEILCFNYLIDNDNLYVQSQQDLYTAHQILHLRPAINTLSQSDLKDCNTWIYNYFPNSNPGEANKTISRDKQARLFHFVTETLNLFLLWLWGWFWNKKGIQNSTGGTRWDAHQIKLHTKDHRSYVYRQFASIQSGVRQKLDENLPQASGYEMNANKKYA